MPTDGLRRLSRWMAASCAAVTCAFVVSGGLTAAAPPGRQEPAGARPNAPAGLSSSRKLLDQYLRLLPQREAEEWRARARPGRGRSPHPAAGHLGKGHPEAARRRDAAGRSSPSGQGRLRRAAGVARDASSIAPRRRRRIRAHGRVPSVEPHRVPERHSRSARRRRHGLRPPAAGRRLELRLRQHRRRAEALLHAARALPLRRAQDQPPGRGRPQHRRRMPSRPGCARTWPQWDRLRGAAARHPRRPLVRHYFPVGGEYSPDVEFEGARGALRPRRRTTTSRSPWTASA